jgi:hypothetical protein
MSSLEEEGPKMSTISVRSFTWLLMASNSLILFDRLSDFSASFQKNSKLFNDLNKCGRAYSREDK